MNALPWLDANAPEAFPNPECALRFPEGLLAAGGDLSPRRLLAAYRSGIFPWYEEGQPILWWCPDPRAVLFPAELKISRSLRKTLRRGAFRLSIDQAFDEVTLACAAPRPTQSGTWITHDVRRAYGELHRLGHAHSVETWSGGELAGGLYGVAIGRVFFGESMFSRATDASKVALAHLVANLREWDYGLIDCQIESAHLTSLGSRPLSRRRFLRLVAQLCREAPADDAWASPAVASTPEFLQN